MDPEPGISVVIATRNRRESLLSVLERLVVLPERPEIVVVDNASVDGTSARVAEAFPDVRLLSLDENRGTAARNLGVRAATAPWIAFSDDDSWWLPGALSLAVESLEGCPRLGVVAARVLLGKSEVIDPVCNLMAASPLEVDTPLPGPPVLGFVACGAVVRRSAFLAVGGFSEQLAFVGEERLLAVDLAAAGWFCAYVPEIVARHAPSPLRDPGARRRQSVRNELWYAWLRLSAVRAAGRTLSVTANALRDRDGRLGLIAAAAGAPTVVRQRRPLPRDVERAALRVDGRHLRARATNR